MKAPPSRSCHIDRQITTGDFEATPRRDWCNIWLWLTDVPEARAAMRCMPRSHRAINAHWERTLSPEHKARDVGGAHGHPRLSDSTVIRGISLYLLPIAVG
jgi:hypothetical protein